MKPDAVIVWNAGKGDVISRFVLALSKETGWPIERRPNPKIEINYFPLYIQVGQSPKEIKGLSKVASLFSHLETDIPKKAEWWETAANLVDIRLTWARRYYEMLLPYGETHLVIPPIDPQFKPKRKPIIGTSGFVHPGGRKGEQLIKRLHDEYSHIYEIRASGKGWPIPNVVELSWEAMHLFYETLDVYLCTSLIEGIPMPPLEALAMGKRVVVPLGVGLLDSIISPLAFRYEAGNFDSMVAALQLATGQVPHISDVFSAKNWADSHRAAFGLIEPETARGGLITAGVPYIIQESSHVDFVPKKPVKADLSDDSKKAYSAPTIKSIGKKIKASGAIVVAYGKPARHCAVTCIQSWQKFMPDYPIALVSDAPIEGIDCLFIEHPDTDIGARSVKTQLYDIAPADWENVLYLDADTEIVANVNSLFAWLDSGFDFLVCTNPGLYIDLTHGRRPDNVEELEYTIGEVGTGEVMQSNGGVFAFHRGERAAAFMRGWHSEWLRYKARDQFALIRTLHKNPVKLLMLGNEWNTILRFCPAEMTAGILHHAMTARRWSGIIYGALDSDEAWKRVIE